MMQVIRLLRTMLLLASQTELASSTDPARESDSDECAEFDVVAAWAECDDAPDTFVAADVGEFDGCYRFAVSTGGCAGFGVKI